jgi:hypothetical protein
MSGRISSQGSVIMISDDLDAVTADIASATKAKPCVITLDVGATAPVVGEIVVPRGMGWNSLDGMPFKVSAVTGQAVTLEDSDTTRETATLPVAPADLATLSTPTWLELCRSNFNANNPAGATLDVTTLCDTAHRIVAGLPAIGTWTAAGFYDCSDTAMFRARDAYRSGEDVAIDVRVRDGCGWTFMAIVNTFDLTLGVNAPVANNIGGQIDGMIHFYKTPPVGFVPLETMVRGIKPATNVGAQPSGPAPELVPA